MASISAGINLIDITEDREEQEKAKRIMKRQIKQLTNLVDDLLDINRISQSRMNFKKEIIDLNKTTNHIIEDLKPEFEKRAIQLYTKIQKHPIYINADTVRIVQMIGNILSNALKFTNKGGIVWLTLTQRKQDAVIEIKDNGIGIDPGILPNLFELFTQAEQGLDRRGGGLGLGLYIVKGIVELHGGKVKAYSAGIGRGSEFTIYLPLVKEEGK